MVIDGHVALLRLERMEGFQELRRCSCDRAGKCVPRLNRKIPKLDRGWWIMQREFLDLPNWRVVQKMVTRRHGERVALGNRCIHVLNLRRSICRRDRLTRLHFQW